jgi:hypothetical protein
MCCVVGFLAYAGAALAQPAATSESAAAFDAGRKLLAQHRPAEACAKFAHAIELEPGNVGVMLNLGLCNEQLDKQATALTWFRRAKARAGELELAESVRAAGDKIAALSRTVPTLRLALSPPAVVATVTVDGAAVAASEFARVELDAGHHVIEVAAAGSAGMRREVDVVDGAATPIELAVPPPAPPVRPPEVAAPRPATSPGAVAPRGRAYIAAAVGGGLVLGSVALGLLGRSEARSTEHPDTARDWKAAVRYGGTSMFVIGGAALGWAVWTYVRAPGERAERAPAIVAPAIGDRSVGIGVQGAF